MKQLLILSIFLTSVFAQSQMQRKNPEDMEKMETVSYKHLTLPTKA